MSKLKIKALLYQLICFAVLFLLIRYLAGKFMSLGHFWGSFWAFALGTILSPKFLVIKIKENEKLFVKWFFAKGLKEL